MNLFFWQTLFEISMFWTISFITTHLNIKDMKILINKIHSLKLFKVSMGHTPIIPAPGGLKKNCEFKVSLGSIPVSKPSHQQQNPCMWSCCLSFLLPSYDEVMSHCPQQGLHDIQHSYMIQHRWSWRNMEMAKNPSLTETCNSRRLWTVLSTSLGNLNIVFVLLNNGLLATFLFVH